MAFEQKQAALEDFVAVGGSTDFGARGHSLPPPSLPVVSQREEEKREEHCAMKMRPN